MSSEWDEYPIKKELPDGRVAAVVTQIFNWKVIVGPAHGGWIDDGW